MTRAASRSRPVGLSRWMGAVRDDQRIDQLIMLPLHECLSNFDQLWRFFGPILAQRSCLGGTPEAMYQNVDNKHSMRCWTCHTPLTPQNGVDLHGGVSIEQFICQTCGRHWYGGERPRPKLTADPTTN